MGLLFLFLTLLNCAWIGHAYPYGYLAPRGTSGGYGMGITELASNNYDSITYGAMKISYFGSGDWAINPVIFSQQQFGSWEPFVVLYSQGMMKIAPLVSTISLSFSTTCQITSQLYISPSASSTLYQYITFACQNLLCRTSLSNPIAECFPTPLNITHGPLIYSEYSRVAFVGENQTGLFVCQLDLGGSFNNSKQIYCQQMDNDSPVYDFIGGFAYAYTLQDNENVIQWDTSFPPRALNSVLISGVDKSARIMTSVSSSACTLGYNSQFGIGSINMCEKYSTIVSGNYLKQGVALTENYRVIVSSSLVIELVSSSYNVISSQDLNAALLSSLVAAPLNSEFYVVAGVDVDLNFFYTLISIYTKHVNEIQYKSLPSNFSKGGRGNCSLAIDPTTKIVTIWDGFTLIQLNPTIFFDNSALYLWITIAAIVIMCFICTCALLGGFRVYTQRKKMQEMAASNNSLDAAADYDTFAYSSTQSQFPPAPYTETASLPLPTNDSAAGGDDYAAPVQFPNSPYQPIDLHATENS